jgi:hypothetical protein
MRDVGMIWGYGNEPTGNKESAEYRTGLVCMGCALVGTRPPIRKSRLSWLLLITRDALQEIQASGSHDLVVY